MSTDDQGSLDKDTRGVRASPTHPLEREVVEMVTFYFNNAPDNGEWMWDRLPVAASFFAGERVLFTAKLHNTKALQDGRVAGTVQLTYNIASAIQNPAVFLEEVVPQSVGTALAAIEVASPRRKATADADVPAWAVWFKRVTGRAPIRPQDQQRAFNWLATDLLSGRTLARCDCQAWEGLAALTPEMVAKVGQDRCLCTACGAAYRLVGTGDRPQWVADEVEFLASLLRPRRQDA